MDKGTLLQRCLGKMEIGKRGKKLEENDCYLFVIRYGNFFFIAVNLYDYINILDFYVFI